MAYIDISFSHTRNRTIHPRVYPKSATYRQSLWLGRLRISQHSAAAAAGALPAEHLHDAGSSTHDMILNLPLVVNNIIRRQIAAMSSSGVRLCCRRGGRVRKRGAHVCLLCGDLTPCELRVRAARIAIY